MYNIHNQVKPCSCCLLHLDSIECIGGGRVDPLREEGRVGFDSFAVADEDDVVGLRSGRYVECELE